MNELPRKLLRDADEHVARALAFEDNLLWDEIAEQSRASYLRMAEAARRAMVRFVNSRGHPLAAAKMTKFIVGQRVVKARGYRGAGEVRGVFTTSAGELRYNVEHRIEGGDKFIHIYDELTLAFCTPEPDA